MGALDPFRPRWFGNFEGKIDLFVLTDQGWKSEKKVAEEKIDQAEQRKVEESKQEEPDS